MAQYSLIVPTTFGLPPRLGLLILPAQTIAAMSTTMRDTHIGAVRVFREVLGVKSALIQKLITAIEGTCLEEIRNCISNSITVKIFDLLNRLQGN